MVIEWLGFRVEPKLREKFIEEDEKIWTPVLADADGFLGKEIWIAPGQSDRVFFDNSLANPRTVESSTNGTFGRNRS